MALRLRPKVSSVGSPFLQLGSSATAFVFSQACSVPNLGFKPARLQRKKYLSPTTFSVRASRTESTGVTLGFRAPQFESQDVAQDFGAVCTPEFFLFKKAITIRTIIIHCTAH
ncbi:hypothetical protein V8G54_005984 [Vigna mungo]|uniref:Uncharacterized protein n=1 Tax=Vigna mungo TaxID=3915 RepID=A0AAQ3S604_VIGMU